MNHAAFLDRDGVINRKAPEGEYITTWEQMEFLPGVVDGIALLNQAGFHVIVVTNQRCVAKGLISIEALNELHSRMRAYLESKGAVLNDIYFCPHDNFPPCGCRKPQPGMLLRAASEHSIEISRSWMIGDSKADAEAGRSAGCKTVLVHPHLNYAEYADLAAGSLLDAAKMVIAASTEASKAPI